MSQLTRLSALKKNLNCSSRIVLCHEVRVKTVIMIEFQLTDYICSQCTRVHNKEHSLPTGSSETTTAVNLHQTSEDIGEVDDLMETSSFSTSLPFIIVDDFKPDMNDSDLQRQRILVENNVLNKVAKFWNVISRKSLVKGERFPRSMHWNQSTKSVIPFRYTPW